MYVGTDRDRVEVGELDGDLGGGDPRGIVEDFASGVVPRVEEAGRDCEVERASDVGVGGVAPSPSTDGRVAHEAAELVTAVAVD